jgi:hypothetical protein
VEITQFSFRLILIFVPGLVAFLIVENLAVHKEWKLARILLYALLLGLVSYLVYYLVTRIPFLHLRFCFFDILMDSSKPVSVADILGATIASVFVGFAMAYLNTYKVLHRIAHRLRASKKFADLDVWSYLMNSPLTGWVLARDLDKDVAYIGWVVAYSDTGDERELLLKDASVYTNKGGELLYKTPWLYLSMPRDKCFIECPPPPEPLPAKVASNSRKE